MKKETGVFAHESELKYINELYEEHGQKDWKLHQSVMVFAIHSGLDEDFFYTMNLRTGEFIRVDSMLSGKDKPAPHTSEVTTKKLVEALEWIHHHAEQEGCSKKSLKSVAGKALEATL